MTMFRSQLSPRSKHCKPWNKKRSSRRSLAIKGTSLRLPQNSELLSRRSTTSSTSSPTRSRRRLRTPPEGRRSRAIGRDEPWGGRPSRRLADDPDEHAEHAGAAHVDRLHRRVGRLEADAVALREPLLERGLAILGLGDDDVAEREVELAVQELALAARLPAARAETYASSSLPLPETYFPALKGILEAAVKQSPRMIARNAENASAEGNRIQ